MSFNIDEIKHGILRGNRKAPGSYFKLFSANDPRNNFLQVYIYEYIYKHLFVYS